MTRRETAINDAIMAMRPDSNLRVIFNDLIDQAEAGKLKEPIARSYAGINGVLTVYPDGREERS